MERQSMDEGTTVTGLYPNFKVRLEGNFPKEQGFEMEKKKERRE